MNNKKKKILESIKNTYCRLRPSGIEGVGVFAVRNIPKGKDPFLGISGGRWHKFHIKELSRIDKEVKKMIDDFFVIEKDGYVYLPEGGLNGIDISFFLNNSDKPNLKIVGDGKDEALYFRTLRNIKKGEELSVSYSTYDDKYK